VGAYTAIAVDYGIAFYIKIKALGLYPRAAPFL